MAAKHEEHAKAAMEAIEAVLDVPDEAAPAKARCLTHPSQPIT